MYLKDQLEQLAKENAFEYDTSWWNQQKTEYAKDRIGGNIVAFYKGRNIFNGVVALWGRDKRSAVLFYTTPHDVEDERKHGWIPPVFRVEVHQDSCFRPPKNPKAANPAEEPAEPEFPVNPAPFRRVRFEDMVQRVPEAPVPAAPVVIDDMINAAPENELIAEELFINANRW